MADDKGVLGFWRRFLARPNTDRTKMLGVAFLVALGCGVVVSSAAVTLRPIQEANRDAERQQLMAQMLARLPGMQQILDEVGAQAVETLVVDLDRGKADPSIDPALYDPVAAAADPERSTPLSAEEDVAGIGRRENYAPVYLVRRDGELALVVLPVRAAGYQSVIRAYLALEADLNTVAALTVYEQGETPGLGARIAEEAWQRQWPGKQVADDGAVTIEVVRGSGSGPHQVDGISGASVTGRAVTNMIRFWLGARGFGPFLDNLRQGDI